MRAPGRRSRARAALAIAALAPLVSLTGGSAAASGCQDGGVVGAVQLITIPPVPDADVTLAGARVRLSDRGTATVSTCRATLVDDLTAAPEPVDLGPGRRARYDRMFVTGGGQQVALAYSVDYLTDVRPEGLPTELIDSVTLRSSTGQRIEQEDPAPTWLWGARVIRSASGLQQRDIYYTVESVLVRGTNAVNASQVKFYPRTTRTVPVPLLTYDLEIQVSDRLFGLPAGTTARLEAADGSVLDVPLIAGAASVASVPRGSYIVTVDAPGLNTPRPLSVSRDQDVDLPVLTYLDITVLMGAPGLAAVLLILVPRPGLRARLAFWRRRPRHKHQARPSRPQPPTPASTRLVEGALDEPELGHPVAIGHR